jgi:hypothetical protein
MPCAVLSAKGRSIWRAKTWPILRYSCVSRVSATGSYDCANSACATNTRTQTSKPHREHDREIQAISTICQHAHDTHNTSALETHRINDTHVIIAVDDITASLARIATLHSHIHMRVNKTSCHVCENRVNRRRNGQLRGERGERWLTQSFRIVIGSFDRYAYTIYNTHGAHIDRHT